MWGCTDLINWVSHVMWMIDGKYMRFFLTVPAGFIQPQQAVTLLHIKCSPIISTWVCFESYKDRSIKWLVVSCITGDLFLNCSQWVLHFYECHARPVDVSPNSVPTLPTMQHPRSDMTGGISTNCMQLTVAPQKALDYLYSLTYAVVLPQDL